ncbi:MAG: hypothetical protein ISS93_00530 [Candidatus Aenigmarchaeota archaeon]|nr:hypothetical protein [Candidatus Aenigmarchaeota archaeon]
MVSKIRIVSCGSREGFVKRLIDGGFDKEDDYITDLLWYKDKIGKEYTVRKEGNMVYFAGDADKYHTVDKADAVVLK